MKQEEEAQRKQVEEVEKNKGEDLEEELITKELVDKSEKEFIPIRSLYCLSSISMHLEWKKWRNNVTGPFLAEGSSLAKQGLKPSGSILRHKVMFVGGKTFLLKCITFS